MRLRLLISCSKCTGALCSLHLCRDVLTVYRIPAAHRVCSARTLPRSTKETLKWNVGKFSIESFVTDGRQSRTPYHSSKEEDKAQETALVWKHNEKFTAHVPVGENCNVSHDNLISVEAALPMSSQARREQLSLSDKLAHIVSILLLLIYLVPMIK